MELITLIVISFALSLDAFAVSINCGIKLQYLRWPDVLKIATTFALFQAGMPIIGWGAAHYVKEFVLPYAPFIAFIVFFVLGVKTLYDVFISRDNTECKCLGCVDLKCLLTLAVATSIDALLIGAVFSLYDVPLLVTVLIIGVITFFMSMLGSSIGVNAVKLFKKNANILAGVILLALSIKVIWEKF
jgi:manganese efflux pump family protein